MKMNRGPSVMRLVRIDPKTERVVIMTDEAFATKEKLGSYFLARYHRCGSGRLEEVQNSTLFIY